MPAMRTYVRFLIIASVLVVISGLTCCKPEKKVAGNSLPNIVLFFVDDLGYGDLSCFGATQYKTPYIDKMAAEGLRFTNFYVGQAVCSASRAALMTGCYPNRVGISGALNPFSKIGLNPDEETIAEVLKKKGYQCGIFGKWHLGRPVEFLPLQQGFDEYVGLPYSNDMWKYKRDGTLKTPNPKKIKTSYPELPVLEGNDILMELNDLEDQEQLTTLYTERAIQFIDKNKDKPFFAYIPHSMPHVPLAVSDKFKGKSEQGMYGDVIMEIDWSVGQVIAALEKNGLTENTLVIFTSDNSPWLNFGDHAGSAGGLREGKQTSWEGGQRVPCVMKWPGHTPVGEICNKMAATIDLLPTIAEITGVPLPEKKIDGVNILPLIEGDKHANPREILYYYFGKNQLEGVRKNQWKLVFPHDYSSYDGLLPANSGLKGPKRNRTSGLELYDMRRDPGERYNVAEQHPEVVEELQKIGELARQDLGDSITGEEGKNRRKPGEIL